MINPGINNIIYVELHSGPKIANGTCGKTTNAGTIDRGSTVYIYINKKSLTKVHFVGLCHTIILKCMVQKT
jgi:hypothetical protein